MMDDQHKIIAQSGVTKLGFDASTGMPVYKDPLTVMATDIRELKSSMERLTRVVERLADVEMRKELDDELIRLGLHDIRGIIPANRHVPREPDKVCMMWELPRGKVR